MIVPENSLVLGVPGKIIKQDKKFRETALFNAEEYRRLSKSHIDKKHESFVIK